MKPLVYVTQPIPQPGLDLLKQSFDVKVGKSGVILEKKQLITKVKSCDALLSMLVDRIDDEVMSASPQLKIVANYAVGYDNINITAAGKRNIIVTNTPGVLAATTADLAWALLMAAGRRIAESDRYTRKGLWTQWKSDLLLGQDIHHATLGIIGMGSIGTEVAQRARGFSMRILYHNRTRNKKAEKELKAEYVDLMTLLKESDFITLHCPLTPQTTNLISTREFEMMKSNCILINTSRGPVVDQKALYKALKKKQIAGAGLDVYQKEPVEMTEPLLKLDNVVFTPHIGSASIQTRTKMALMAAQNIVAVLQGKSPINPVNL